MYTEQGNDLRPGLTTTSHKVVRKNLANKGLFLKIMANKFLQRTTFFYPESSVKQLINLNPLTVWIIYPFSSSTEKRKPGVYQFSWASLCFKRPHSYKYQVYPNIKQHQTWVVLIGGCGPCVRFNLSAALLCCSDLAYRSKCTESTVKPQLFVLLKIFVAKLWCFSHLTVYLKIEMLSRLSVSQHRFYLST